MLLGCDLDWFAVVTRPQGEHQAKRAMERYGIDCFLPTYSKVIRKRGVKRFCERMLFPGYVLRLVDIHRNARRMAARVMKAAKL